MNSQDKNYIFERILGVISSICVAGPKTLHEPEFGGNEKIYLNECIDSTYVSSVGRYVDKFEDEISAFTKSKNVVVTTNATAALHIALLLSGVKQGDEVLIPSMTFVATANAVTYCGAIPHFIDCEESSCGIDPVVLSDWLKYSVEMVNGLAINKITKRVIRAIMPMHCYGHPCDLDRIVKIAHQYNLQLIEDSAEALGSYYHGRHVGTFGKLGVLSFNGNKIITTGGGGALLIQDDELAKKAKHITTTARILHNFKISHDEVGYNYRMPNVNAAIGCAQIERLPDFIQRKRNLAKQYSNGFLGLNGIHFLDEPKNTQSNYWLNTIILSPENANLKDDLLIYLNNAGYQCRAAWTPMHTLPMFHNCPQSSLFVTESLFDRVINIPSSPSIKALSGI